MSKKIKFYRGQIPSADHGWNQVARLKCEDGFHWLVFEQRQGHSDSWVTIKLVAEDRAPRKANYWLALNRRTGQFGFARDFALMREHRPILHARFSEVLQS